MRKVVLPLASMAIASLVITGAALAATINGTAKNDHLEGTPKADTISGRAGNDYIEGLAGDDELIGGRGDDTLWERFGDDKLYGWSGDDTLIGWKGYDRLDGGDGHDRLVNGDDMFGGNGPDRIGDAVWNQPQGGSFTASGGAGDDRINAEDHHFEVQDGISTPDTVKCGPGEDTVRAESDDTVAEDCEHVRIVVH
jgi:Ca2+-binding RTX toxin-like protein